MFLISRDSRDLDHDIIASLIEASRRGCATEILIDKDQYDAQNFVQDAVTKLSTNIITPIKIAAIEVVNSGILHDKLILFVKNVLLLDRQDLQIVFNKMKITKTWFSLKTIEFLIILQRILVLLKVRAVQKLQVL